MRVGERAKEDRVDEGEDRGVRGNREGERRDDERRCRRLARARAQGEAEISENRRHTIHSWLKRGTSAPAPVLVRHPARKIGERRETKGDALDGSTRARQLVDEQRFHLRPVRGAKIGGEDAKGEAKSAKR